MDVEGLKKRSLSWGLDPETYWFGIVGAVSERKNLPLVVDALANLQGGKVGLVIGGQIAPNVRGEIPKLTGRLTLGNVAVVIHDRLLDDVELDSLICAVDCVVLAHSNEGSSGVMGKAVAVGTRIAAAGARSLKVDCGEAPRSAGWSHLTETDLKHLLDRCSRLEAPTPLLGPSSRDFVSALL